MSQEPKKAKMESPELKAAEAETIANAVAGPMYYSFTFEVSGRVQGTPQTANKFFQRVATTFLQGVHFRRATKVIADNFGVTGWVRNDPSGTVEGYAEGYVGAVAMVKKFLAAEGTARSHVTQVVFKEEVAIHKRHFTEFTIRH